MARDAVAGFQDLVRARRDEWLPTLEGFRTDLRGRRCLYGDRDLVHYLRPHLLTEEEEASLRRAAEAVFSASAKMASAALGDPALLAELDLTEGERRLVEIDPRIPDPFVLARLDAFLTADGPRFVELNGECPAGPGYSDVLSEAFLDHPLVRAFAGTWELRRFEERRILLDTLLSVWRNSGGRGRPRIAIVDYAGLPTEHEFHIIAEFFRRSGYDTAVEDPRTLVFEEGVLRGGSGPIDLVYRRVLVNEFLDRHAEVRALEDALRAGCVRVVNPFRCKLIHKKAIFALITGDDRERYLTTDEMALVDAYVPWTRRVRPMKTRKDGALIDLLPFLATRREGFVLKPNDEYGGRGVVLGWERSASEWSAALHRAAEGSWVVQERVTPVLEPFPAMSRGLAPEPLIVDCDPYLYLGRMHGCLSRLSAGSLANVTSGGGQVPAFVVAPRHPENRSHE